METNSETIDVFAITETFSKNEDFDFNEVLRKSSKKRKWFSPEMYHCHPLFIANQYGYELVLDTDVNVFWNGGTSHDDLKVGTYYNSAYKILSHFGYGIVSFGLPFILRTPPLVNLLVTNPFNHEKLDRTCMSAVIENDNLKYTFTINIRVLPNTTVSFKRGDALSSILPIPRYFQDAFRLQNGFETHEENEIKNLLQTAADTVIVRRHLSGGLSPNGWDKTYKSGTDIYGNPFEGHQRTI